jgi:hypothetical protein
MSAVVTHFNASRSRVARGLWRRLSVAAAAIAMVGNVAAVAAVERVYGSSYPSLTEQAIAQDVTNLVVVSPMIIVFAAWAARGSVRAYVGWLGALMFTVYNYVIYSVAIHFGPLFLLWVAVLGLSTYALLGSLITVEPAAVQANLHDGGRRLAGWFLIVAAALFALLWLSDIIRALVAGGVPTAVTDLGVPTNPVHVLDLAVFLPAAALAGVLLLQRAPLGSVLAPALLMFLGLTGLPILLTPIVSQLRGNVASWGAVAPIAVITLTSLALFVRTSRVIR